MANKSYCAGRKKNSVHPARRNKAEEKRKGEVGSKRESLKDTLEHFRRIENLIIELESLGARKK